MMGPKWSYDVAIIGGGVCGSAIAYYLAKAGTKVVLLEKGDLCSGTSGTNPGFCVLTYREDPLVLQLALEQSRLFPELAQELGVDLEYVRTGGLIPLRCRQEEEAVSTLVANCRQWGLREVEIIKPEQAGRQEPALDHTRIIAAAYCPLEGKINPFKLTLGLAQKARQLGADLLSGTEVKGMEIIGGAIKTLCTSRGPVKADLVICAAGAWTRDIVRLAGTDLPVAYERGEAMVSVPLPQVVRGIVTDGAFFVKNTAVPKVRAGACLAQTASGNVVMAQATSDVENYDRGSTHEGPMAIARKVALFFPRLAKLEVIRMWAGVVAYTSDGLPVFGFVENPANLFVLTGFHSAIGIAPALGRMVQEIYLRGETPNDVAAYSPLRFTSTGCMKQG